MESHTGSIWERLISPDGTVRPESVRRAIARDLDTLLNTRTAIPPHELSAYPHCRDSIANFGLADFAQLCLTSHADREQLCALLAAAITRHEPRLHRVVAQLVDMPGSINRLSFVIHGQLHGGTQDSVRFDLTLQPSNLRYAID